MNAVSQSSRGFFSSRAVLIGTSKYTHLQDVPAATNSLERMYQTLTSDICEWPTEQVTLIANRQDLDKLPLELIDLYGDIDDVALFYYVGHGQSDHNGRLCLSLGESRTDPRYRSSTSLEFEHVRAALQHSNARIKIVILDCCFAGLAIQSTLGMQDVADIARCDGTYTMAASAEYDVARYEEDDTKEPLTYFTKHLIEIISEGIPGQGDALTMQALFQEVNSRMRASRLSPPTQANRDSASYFQFARNVATEYSGTLPTGIFEALQNPLSHVRKAVISTLRELASMDTSPSSRDAATILERLATSDPDSGVRHLAAQASNSQVTRTNIPRTHQVIQRPPERRRPSSPRLTRARAAALTTISTLAMLFSVLPPIDMRYSLGTGSETIPSTTGSNGPDRRPTGSEIQQVEDLVRPPALPGGYDPPIDTGAPDATYHQTVACTIPTHRSSADTSWAQIKLNVDGLHTYATGANQTVAIIDTGVNKHKFLQDRILAGGDYVRAADRGLNDCDGHGTRVAGIVAAKPPPSSQDHYTGMAPDARVISIRQTSLNYETNVPGLGNASSRARSAGNLSTLAQAVVRAADKGATVIEVSVTSCRPVGQITEDERELQAALRYAFETRNVVVVTPSGNTGAGTTCGEQNKDPNHPRTIITPAWFSEYVLSVAALKNDGGPIEESLHGPWVGVAAPGDGLTTLDPYDLDEISDRVLSMRGDVTPISGTTYASAYVAGLAALIREYRPELDARQVISRIKSTAIHPHSPGGWNDEVGFGMINPIEALRSESVPGE